MESASVSSRGLTREGSRRELHFLGKKDTENDDGVSPVSVDALALQQSFEDMSKYDFDPKLCATKFSTEKVVDLKTLSECRTKEVTKENTQIQDTRPIATCKPDSEFLDEDRSYHEEITGKEAEKRLKLCTNHGYLTRHSIKNQHYILSVCKKTADDYVCKHLPIVFKNDGARKEYRIGEKGKAFNGLQEMLRFYERYRIDPALTSIGVCVTESEYNRKKEEENVPRPQAQTTSVLNPLLNRNPTPRALEEQQQANLSQPENTTNRKKRCLIL